MLVFDRVATKEKLASQNHLTLLNLDIELTDVNRIFHSVVSKLNRNDTVEKCITIRFDIDLTQYCSEKLLQNTK